MRKRITCVFCVLFLLLFLLLAGCGPDVDLILQNGAESSGDAAESGTEPDTREEAPEDTEEGVPADSAEGGSDGSAPAGESAADAICVYICGAVVNPGVYEVPVSSRIYELVDLAGGMTDDADTDSVNLALAVEDGDMVRIPTREETAGGSAAAGVVSGEQGIVSGSGTGSGGSGGTSGGKVNINTAGLEELTSLNGIGDAKAAAIVAYREEHGSFGSIEEIMEVSGIGEGTYDKIKEDITT